MKKTHREAKAREPRARATARSGSPHRDSIAGRGRKSRRNVVVLASLLASLTLTSVLLLILAPAPLARDAKPLIATTDESPFEAVFDTDAPFDQGRWQYIFIRQSKVRRGNTAMLREDGSFGDHFLIGNGDGCPDGQVEMSERWLKQQPAELAGANVAGNCISICLVGDFDSRPPTAAQRRALGNLVRTLQQGTRITSRGILLKPNRADAFGIGKQFPVQDFLARLTRP